MNAANNLQPYSLLNVAQMAAVGSDSSMNIVVQWKQASQNCPDCAPNNGKVSFEGTHRYYIKAHSQADVSAIANGNTASLEDAGERLPDPTTNNAQGQSDMGDYRVLADFIKWGTTTYPANNLIVVLWDHGSGWLSGPDLGRSVKLAKQRAISFDDQTNNQIEAWQTPLALAAAQQPIDVVAVDCSLEQMIEVGYNIKSSAKILCGSEESPPGAGYPYDKWLADVKAKAANPCAASQLLVNDFVAAYPQQTDITQSALDLSKMPQAAAAVDAFASSLLTHISDSASVIAQARTNARSFDLNAGYFNYDIVDFAQQIISRSTKSDLVSTATAVQQAIAGNSNPNSVVMYHAYGASTPTASHGLAIWLPQPGYNYSDYTSLQFTNDYPHWNQFLNSEQQ
jgi:hypothetical protein